VRPGRVASTGVTQIRDSVVNALEVVTGQDRERLTDESTLTDLGIDSMDLLEVGAIVEQEFGIDLDIEDFADIRTLGDAIELFERLLVQ
jgi:acyl carrier protein